MMQNVANFEGFTVNRFPGNDEFHSRETGMGLFPGFPGTGTGMDALIKISNENPKKQLS